MRILQISDVSPDSGYPEVGYLARGLSDMGHTVTVFCPNINVYNENKKLFAQTTTIFENNVEVKYFNCELTLLNFQITFKLISELRKRIKDFDIVHIHGHRHFQAMVGYYFARQKNIPYIITAGGSVPHYVGNKWGKKIYDWIVGNSMLRSAAKLIAYHNLEKSQYLEMGCPEKQIAIIPIGMDKKDFQVLPPKGRFRNKYNIAEEFIVLYLGRVHYIKGLDYLVLAFAQVAQQLPSVRLVIAGADDGYLSAVKQLIARERIANKVTFTGYISGTDKLETLVDADVLILPSRYEIFGIVILEALSCETPIITTPNCGLAEEVEREKLGKVVPLEVNELALAIKQLLIDQESRKHAGQRGREVVFTQFSAEKMCQRHEELYYSCLGGS